MGDYQAIFSNLRALPNKKNTGQGAHPWTNEEDWILWETWNSKPRHYITKAFKVCYDTAKQRYQALSFQGGPKGARPEWMK